MEIKIKVDIPSLEEIKSKLHKAPEVSAVELRKAIETSIETIAGKARREAPWNKRSGGGTLAQSIRSKMLTKFSGEVKAHAKYSMYVHEGTRPSAGRFVPGLGSDGRGRRLVNPRRGVHPGIPANPFMLRAVEKSKNAINNAFEKALKNIIKSFK